MSLFFTATCVCPDCATPNTLEFPASVNADRRDDLRDAIIDGSLYTRPCVSCGLRLMFDPHMTYLDIGRGQWILADAPDHAAAWRAAENEAATLYDRAFGARAPAPARQLGAGLSPRIVFGWPALVEKLRCEELGLDDAALEMAKLAVLRDGPVRGLDPAREWRLRGRDETTLALDRVDPATGAGDARMDMPFALYQDIVDAPDAWAELRAELAGRMFVDIARVLRDGGPGLGEPGSTPA